MTTAELGIEAASALAQGGRARQEDAVVAAFHQGANLGFAVLSDGMGGHASGDLASRIIVAEIFAELTLATARGGIAAAAIPAMLREAVSVANQCLAAHVAGTPEARGMGGTVIVAVVESGRLHWISVGDSLLYLYRDGQLRRLNEDHSMAPQIDLLVARGVIDAERGRTHPQRSCLTSALCGDTIAEIDCPEVPLALDAGDLLLVASDGLLSLPEARIAAILKKARRRASGQIAGALLQAVAAVADPDQDNISLVVLKADPLPQGRAAAAGAPGTGMVRAFAQAFAPLRPFGSRSG